MHRHPATSRDAHTSSTLIGDSRTVSIPLTQRLKSIKLLPASLVLVYLVLSLFKYQQPQILEPSVNWETHHLSAETVCWFLHLWVFPFSQIPENPMKGLRKSFARKIGKLTSVWSFSMKFQTDKNVSRKLKKTELGMGFSW